MQITKYSQMIDYFQNTALPCFEKGKKYFQDLKYRNATIYFNTAYEVCSEISDIFHDRYRLFKIKESESMTNENTDLFEKNFYDTYIELGYYYALCCYYNGDFDKSLYIADYVADGSVTSTKVLISQCYRKIKPYERNYSLSFTYMESVVKDKTYISSIKNKLEEELYVNLIIKLSEIYRVGSEYERTIMGRYSPYNGLLPDIEKAMNLLVSIQQYIKYDSNKILLNNALSHYKKKLFGGYKYI